MTAGKEETVAMCGWYLLPFLKGRICNRCRMVAFHEWKERFVKVPHASTSTLTWELLYKEYENWEECEISYGGRLSIALDWVVPVSGYHWVSSGNYCTCFLSETMTPPQSKLWNTNLTQGIKLTVCFDTPTCKWFVPVYDIKNENCVLANLPPSPSEIRKEQRTIWDIVVLVRTN